MSEVEKIEIIHEVEVQKKLFMILQRMNDWKNLAGPEKFERAIMAIGGGAEGILNIFGNAFKEIGKVQQSDMPVEFKATLTGQAIGQGLEQGNLRDLPELTQGVSNWVANR